MSGLAVQVSKVMLTGTLQLSEQRSSEQPNTAEYWLPPAYVMMKYVPSAIFWVHCSRVMFCENAAEEVAVALQLLGEINT